MFILLYLFMSVTVIDSFELYTLVTLSDKILFHFHGKN